MKEIDNFHWSFKIFSFVNFYAKKKYFNIINIEKKM